MLHSYEVTSSNLQMGIQMLRFESVWYDRSNTMSKTDTGKWATQNLKAMLQNTISFYNLVILQVILA